MCRDAAVCFFCAGEISASPVRAALRSRGCRSLESGFKVRVTSGQDELIT